jgi:BA14K-like protein
MRNRLILAASACALIVTALPAVAQDNPRQQPQQYNYPVGRAANDAGPNYNGTPQNTPASGQRTGAADQRQPNGADRYYNYAGSPGGMGAPGGGAIAWCQAHFRSFDPATGTFMGFDGVRHPCP